jgi:hypothetical protein
MRIRNTFKICALPKMLFKTQKKGGVCGEVRGYRQGVGVKTDAPANVVREVITKLATCT